MQAGPYSALKRNELFFSCLDILDELFVLREELESCLQQGYFELALEERLRPRQSLLLSVLSAAVDVPHGQPIADVATLGAKSFRSPINQIQGMVEEQKPVLFGLSPQIREASASFTRAVELAWMIQEKQGKVLEQATNFADLSSQAQERDA
jgi:vacuolar-type H+-ATPase subunit D/Vma8